MPVADTSTLRVFAPSAGDEMIGLTKTILLANAITFAVVSAILIAQSFMGIDNYFNLMLTLPIVLISLLLYALVDWIGRKIKGGGE